MKQTRHSDFLSQENDSVARLGDRIVSFSSTDRVMFPMVSLVDIYTFRDTIEGHDMILSLNRLCHVSKS